ncbi:fluoride efflux transporter CrcB [Devosia sp.]|uniref:fluoride efflux transporter CrcB n=1 Tax=Devosia sp. TaxID=1871048 RepID=UPI003A8DB3E1
MNAYLLVGLGGALGAMGRFGVGNWIGPLRSGFPLPTLVVNFLGSLAMGLLIGFLVRTTPQHQSEIRLFLAVGVFGGFTTFSSFSLDAITLVERGNFGLAGLYVIGSVLLGLAGLWAGMSAIRVIL